MITVSIKCGWFPKKWVIYPSIYIFILSIGSESKPWIDKKVYRYHGKVTMYGNYKKKLAKRKCKQYFS